MPDRRHRARRRRQRVRRWLVRDTRRRTRTQRGDTNTAAPAQPHPQPVTGAHKPAQPDAATLARQVRAALLEDATRTNTRIGRTLDVGPNVVARCRDELLQAKRIHRFAFNRTVTHSQFCWCDPPPPDPKTKKSKPSAATPEPPPPPPQKPWVLVTWQQHTMSMLPPKYFPTRAAAEAAAPTDQPFSVVDGSATDHRPSIDEFFGDRKGQPR